MSASQVGAGCGWPPGMPEAEAEVEQRGPRSSRTGALLLPLLDPVRCVGDLQRDGHGGGKSENR